MSCSRSEQYLCKDMKKRCVLLLLNNLFSFSLIRHYKFPIYQSTVCPSFKICNTGFLAICNLFASSIFPLQDMPLQFFQKNSRLKLFNKGRRWKVLLNHMMHITVKNGRQKLVRREKITLPGLKRQKQLVWNLACLSEKSFQPEVQVKEGTDRVIVDQRDKGSLPHNEAKINIFGTRAVSRFIRNCRSQIASARFCLCSRYTSHLSSLLLFDNHKKELRGFCQVTDQWDASIYHMSHFF